MVIFFPKFYQNNPFFLHIDFYEQVTRAFDMPEPQKLDFIREIGFSHMRIAQGLNTQLQLLGCIARLTQLYYNAH